MNKWLAFGAVLFLTPLGTAYGLCLEGSCWVADTATPIATGMLYLCDSSRLDGVLTFSVPDAEVTEVSLHGRLFSDLRSEWSTILPRPAANRVQVSLAGLSWDQAQGISLSVATIRIVTTSHPEGISGIVSMPMSIDATTWSTAKALYR